MLQQEYIQNWLTKELNIELEAPEGYANHGRRGRVPYKYITDKEVKLMNTRNVEDDKNIIPHYSMITLDVSDLKAYYSLMFKDFIKTYILRDDDHEACYDWIINEALKKLFTSYGCRLDNHHRHDVYKCVYEDIGHIVEKSLRKYLEVQKYDFIAGTKVKTMICGPFLVLARSING